MWVEPEVWVSLFEGFPHIIKSYVKFSRKPSVDYSPRGGTPRAFNATKNAPAALLHCSAAIHTYTPGPTHPTAHSLRRPPPSPSPLTAPTSRMSI